MSAFYPMRIGLADEPWDNAAMPPVISDLADYTVAAWVMDGESWRFVFDSSDGESVVQHEIVGVSRWQISGLRDGIGILDIRVKRSPDGILAYTIDTVCAETVELFCADVRETIIKHRAK